MFSLNSAKSFKEVNFYSKGIKLHGRFFPAVGTVKGSFLLLHGLTSNSAWFLKVATQLSSAGYNVLVYDRRGSGESAGMRGDMPHKDAFFWDMKAATDLIWEQSTKPLHVIAFSYSWKLAPLFIKKIQSESRKVESLIFVAPASDMSKAVQPKVKDLLKVFFNWKGPYFESPVKDTQLTREIETLKFIRDSEQSRAQLKFTRRFLLTSKSLDNEASQVLPKIRKPMLIIVPKDDRVIDQVKVKKRFSQGPVGFARKIIDVDGGHLMDSPKALSQLVDNVLRWVSKPKLATFNQ